jgi:hypothetical protein
VNGVGVVTDPLPLFPPLSSLGVIDNRRPEQDLGSTEGVIDLDESISIGDMRDDVSISV